MIFLIILTLCALLFCLNANMRHQDADHELNFNSDIFPGYRHVVTWQPLNPAQDIAVCKTRNVNYIVKVTMKIKQRNYQ